MIALTQSRLRTFACLAVVALATTLCACDKKPDGAAPAGSGAAPATGGKKAKATLKLADVKKTYKDEFESTAKMKDPMDKKVEAFVAKTGKPESDSGRKKVWYALDGDNCMKVELDGKDGSLMDQSASKADCGM